MAFAMQRALPSRRSCEASSKGGQMRMECLRGAHTRVAAHRIDNQRWTGAGVLVAGLLCASGARAQQISSPTPQFDVTGFIQSATLDGSICPAVSDSALWGGTVTVNGVTMTVPCNTIIQMPANTLAWSDLFPTSTPLPTASTALAAGGL